MSLMMSEWTMELRSEYALPHSYIKPFDDKRLGKLIESGKPLEFGHTLEDQIGGHLAAGFMLTGFFEDRYAEEDNDPLFALSGHVYRNTGRQAAFDLLKVIPTSQFRRFPRHLNRPNSGIC